MERITDQEYINFGKVYKRHMKQKNSQWSKKQCRKTSNVEVLLEACTLIFLTLHAEHVRVFPADAIDMPKYIMTRHTGPTGQKEQRE